jgi:uncharacterized protein YbjQ (UPF0145 family)
MTTEKTQDEKNTQVGSISRVRYSPDSSVSTEKSKVATKTAKTAKTATLKVGNIILTTENNPRNGGAVEKMLVKKRIEIITAQYVFSKENTVEARDKESRKARKKCLTKLKIEAHSLGADAVIGVDLDYCSYDLGHLLLVASGTAVKLLTKEEVARIPPVKLYW